MKRYTHIVLRRMPPLNGFSIKTPEAKFLSDIRPRGIVRELNRMADRLKKLEEENNKLRAEEARLLNTNGELERRIKRLEDRIHRASMAFFRDGSDGHIASQMIQILEEERGKK